MERRASVSFHLRIFSLKSSKLKTPDSIFPTPNSPLQPPPLDSSAELSIMPDSTDITSRGESGLCYWQKQLN